jgi:hypothetical protein
MNEAGLKALYKELLLEWFTTEKELMNRHDYYSYSKEGLKAKLEYYNKGFNENFYGKNTINNGLYSQQKLI